MSPSGQQAYCQLMEPGLDQDKRPSTENPVQQAALADLARLQHESDALGGVFGRARNHFGAADAPIGDPAELWGRRIGRSLSAVAFVVLAAYLYFTYVR